MTPGGDVLETFARLVPFAYALLWVWGGRRKARGTGSRGYGWFLFWRESDEEWQRGADVAAGIRRVMGVVAAVVALPSVKVALLGGSESLAETSTWATLGVLLVGSMISGAAAREEIERPSTRGSRRA